MVRERENKRASEKAR